MESNNPHLATKASATRSSAAPKRVAGGLVLKAKKKKKKIRHNQNSTTNSDPCSSSSGVPSILSSIPVHKEEKPNIKQSSSKHDDEFDDDDATCFGDGDVPSDTLMCLQTYTRSSSGGMAETCAYCPIFTHDEEGDGSINVNGVGSNNINTSTHAAPFIPKHVLLHLLNNKSSTSVASNNNGSSSQIHIEQEIKQLASSNRIRLFQLHGTAMAQNGAGDIGWRGDGNDDEDVAIMETSVYTTAAKMALQSYFHAQSATIEHTSKVEAVHSWLSNAFLPHFAGRTWFSSGALDSFLDNAPVDSNNVQYTISHMKEMIKRFAHAGLLLPRRGVGPRGGEGYWFSLPGLGKAAKSILDGRANLIRRIKSSRYKEKKRLVLEQEIGRIKHPQQGPFAKKQKLEQAGKFVVLDLLAKGCVSIHKTCTGEQFVRLLE